MIVVMTWLSDEDYQFIYTRVVRLCVDLVIKNEAGAILLTKRTIPPQSGTWHLPGGGVRFGETIDQAAARLATEELGITLRLETVLGICEMPGEVMNENDIRHSVSVVYRATIVSGTPTVNTEASSLSYFTTIPAEIYREHGQFLRAHHLLPDAS
jgi:colanic acid biosynthesis protein WcaH